MDLDAGRWALDGCRAAGRNWISRRKRGATHCIHLYYFISLLLLLSFPSSSSSSSSIHDAAITRPPIIPRRKRLASQERPVKGAHFADHLPS
ncbi:uncharacterized protein BO80DRAFT_426143 [Aspergillus ibericus CBS 121593]|uniref:Uncharacterized protein n=1 Tax=Aspergillus ibericus CBS 121593 TaxID=1448316 RepID=A0A395GW57_9EURO|nr:hypothetical protein BO80DRAFT_426143 [Aspergillus ibericus CBS 121593]RAK99766.1 hypothetical protein BO80DRAFT_426143 [Aspergillus ibericus CBS 121593]